MDIQKTDTFDRWLRKLKDKKAKAIIQVHIDRLIENKPGKIKSFGANVYEKKISYGPGYRLYVVRYSKQMVILLCGGDKSTQQNDIQQAKKLAKEINKQLKG